MNPTIWLLAGTTEGRQLAEWLAGKAATVYVSAATAYGASLLPQADNINIQGGRLDYEAMAAFAEQVHPDMIIDATHPYALVVTENIRKLCAAKHIVRYRIVRPAEEEDAAVVVSSAAAAVQWLRQREGNVFLTTGSKDLAAFTLLPQYAERVTVRILPVQDSLRKALDLGYHPSRIIAMQGPFSEDLNRAMFLQCRATFVVTKDSGRIGGYEEKAAAAEKAGARLLVIGRKEETGQRTEDMIAVLTAYLQR